MATVKEAGMTGAGASSSTSSPRITRTLAGASIPIFTVPFPVLITLITMSSPIRMIYAGFRVSTNMAHYLLCFPIFQDSSSVDFDQNLLLSC